MAAMHMGDALMSHPLHLAPPKTEGGRIIVTETGSPTGEAVKGCAFPRKREVPPPARHKTLNLSEEEESLLKASWRVSFEEEPPTETIFRSTRGC